MVLYSWMRWKIMTSRSTSRDTIKGRTMEVVTWVVEMMVEIMVVATTVAVTFKGRAACALAQHEPMTRR